MIISHVWLHLCTECRAGPAAAAGSETAAAPTASVDPADVSNGAINAAFLRHHSGAF